MGEFVKAASTGEVAPGHSHLVVLKGKEIVLFNIEGKFFALDNLCTHEEGPLSEGEIEGHEVTCPWHGAKFDIRTGEVLCDPAYEAVGRHNVRVTGSDIEVEI
jgi:nitrite reductase/ring-hydroxylating ferredoxin subunit